jgi:hypothetical protein
VSGSLSLYQNIYAYNVVALTLTGNMTSMNVGSTRVAGYYFTLALTQDGTGGRTLPANCNNTSWPANGSGIDCPSIPTINTAANSTTYLNFFDDGTTVHYLSNSYKTTGMLSDWTNAGVSNGYAPLWNSGTGQWTPGPVGSGVASTVPGWLQYLGDGSDGSLTCSGTISGSSPEHWYTTFTVNNGATCVGSARNTHIRATTCTINGTLDVSAVGIGNTSTAIYGGGGGGGGGGAASGTAGTATQSGPTTSASSLVAIAGGGAAGTSGSAGGNGSAPASAQVRAGFAQGPAGGYGWGGGGGGAGGSSGGAGGNGGESLILDCGSITFGANNLIDASGGPGQPSTANSVGAGAGGGGGPVIVRSPSITGTPIINVNGGPGGSCTVPMAQWSGGGGSGLTTTATVTTGAISACSVGGTTTGFNSAPKCTIVGGGGTGGTCHYTFSGGTVTGCVVDAGGSGYTSSTFTTCGAGGTGAAGWSKVLAQ